MKLAKVPNANERKTEFGFKLFYKHESEGIVRATEYAVS
jgi:hypothetical protein